MQRAGSSLLPACTEPDLDASVNRERDAENHRSRQRSAMLRLKCGVARLAAPQLKIAGRISGD